MYVYIFKTVVLSGGSKGGRWGICAPLEPLCIYKHFALPNC